MTTDEIEGWHKDLHGTYMYEGKGVITYSREPRGSSQEVDFDGQDIRCSEQVRGYGGYSSIVRIPLALLEELLAFHGYRITNEPKAF